MKKQLIPDEKTLLSIPLREREVPATLDRFVLDAARIRLVRSRRGFIIRRWVLSATGLAAAMVLAFGLFARLPDTGGQRFQEPRAALASATGTVQNTADDKYDWRSFDRELDNIDAALDRGELQQIAQGGY